MTILVNCVEYYISTIAVGLRAEDAREKSKLDKPGSEVHVFFL